MAELKHSSSFTHWVLNYSLRFHKLPTATLLAITLDLILTIDKISSKSQFPQVTLTGKAASAKMVRHRIPTKKKAGEMGVSLSSATRAGCWGRPQQGLRVLSFHQSHSIAFSHFTETLSPQDVMLEQLLHLHSHPISFQDNFLTLTCP